MGKNHAIEIQYCAKASKDFENMTAIDKARFDKVDDLRLKKWNEMQKAFVRKFGLKNVPKIPGTW